MALRDLKTADGSAIAPAPAFAAVLGSSSPDAGGPDTAYAAHLRSVVGQLAP